ncbi:MAG: NADH-quinone oxidoreductase subunit N [Holophaga sp.]|jgi:NADH-quinone oxidoreductase subunit N
MTSTDLLALSPLLSIAATAVAVMLAISVRRSHPFAAATATVGLCAALASLFIAAPLGPRDVTPLLRIDPAGLFFTGLIVLASLVVVLLCHGYYRDREAARPEELYILVPTAALGSAVLACASHFASFFLGLELLSVALYGLVSYERGAEISIEAGIKYLVLAGVSASFLLLGMAMAYFELGTMDFRRFPAAMAGPGVAPSVIGAAVALIAVGVGFKLALVPFHMWTPDVYEGAPAPVSAFVATVSKGAMFAFLLQFFDRSGLRGDGSVLLVLATVAAASMVAGNLLALFQANVKRILAYSSIAHLGYLLVPLEAGHAMARSAAAFYLVVYFATMLGAFGVVTVLSTPGNDRGDLGSYRGLFWRRPMVAGIFTVMLLSLAGIPLTAGFVGKFYLVAAGVSASLWPLVFVLVITSVIGLFYYLRVLIALFSRMDAPTGEAPAPSSPDRPSCTPGSLSWTLAGLTVAVIAIGCFPAPLLRFVQSMMGGGG